MVGSMAFISQSPQGAHLIVFSGISGSGKTYAALEYQAELRAKGYQVLKVNRDDIRTELFGDSYHTVTPIQELERDVTSFQRKLIYHGLKRQWTVISDDTNLHPAGIKDLRRIAEENEARFDEIPVIVPLELALERNRQRAAAGGRFVPEEVIASMFEKQQNRLRGQGKI